MRRNFSPVTSRTAAPLHHLRTFGPSANDGAQGEAGEARAKDVREAALLQFMCEGVHAKLRSHYADTVLAVWTLGQAGKVADVNAIYKALMDQGAATGMTRLYRTLRSLVEGGYLVTSVYEAEGRARRVYALARSGEPWGS
ncbi:hypothetical protein WKW79_13660 [Variovorax robiniae]|uniref:PadR family transcriptional regulator n=1 Tax=Variovorax robiniae TaxID=1836199 RepID=A0ABU8X722_9BURK